MDGGAATQAESCECPYSHGSVFGKQSKRVQGEEQQQRATKRCKMLTNEVKEDGAPIITDALHHLALQFAVTGIKSTFAITACDVFVIASELF